MKTMKKFNIQGICNPSKHYMADISRQLNEIMQLIEEEAYFTINRPRQYGKSTALSLLERKLKKDYLIIRLNMEGLDSSVYQNAKSFVEFLYKGIKRELLGGKNADLFQMLEAFKQCDDFEDLKTAITEFVKASAKEVILMIDEVDSGTNNEVFINFLSVLRDRYNARNDQDTPTFKSVILAGVHDVKNLHYRLTGNENFRKNSPWNIAAPFEVEMSFTISEIESLLKEYLAEHPAVTMDVKQMAEQIQYFTSGYPFLVSYLCKLLHEFSEEVTRWNEENLKKCINRLLLTKITNFESLIKNVTDHRELESLVTQLLIEGKEFSYGVYAPAMEKGILYGVISNDGNGRVKIHNRIYELLIYNYLIERLKTENPEKDMPNHSAWQYRNSDGSLNMPLAFEKYTSYLKSLYDDGQDAFIEKNARLLLGVFMKTIINGIGFFLPETQIADRLRPDITITYNHYKYLIELKIWDGELYFQKSLKQLWDYLERENLEIGYLLIHDFRKERHRRFTHEIIDLNGKKIYVYFV